MTTEEQLTQNLAALSVQDSEELEELMACARYGELEEIQDQVKASGLEKIQRLLLHKGEYGRTPLHMAAANNHAEGPKWKLVAKKSEGKKSNEELSCLSFHHLDIVEYLITIIPPEAINIQNDEGNTALHWAATNGHEDVVKLLITKGKANHKIKNKAGHAAQTEAELHDHNQVVTWLLNNTEPIEETKDNDDGSSSSSSSDEEEEEEEEENDGKEAQGSSSQA
ncbi:hypothetical protein BGX34_011891 [Mortierella sp. NVP85]|nr:hypothetical protein BGX34_011891 [Mortierella sp. NVP85]